MSNRAASFSGAWPRRENLVHETNRETLQLKKTSKTARPGRRVDPVLTEIVRNAVVAITEEMKTNLMRSAYSMIIYEAQDFTVGLFDARGDTVSIGIGLPVFTRGMSDVVKAMIAHFGTEGMHSGDVLGTNDAYLTGSHLHQRWRHP